MKYQKVQYKYKLHETMSKQTHILGVDVHTQYIVLTPNGTLTIRKGYCWNGSNWSIDWKSKEASCFHDCLYQIMRLGLVDIKHRAYADGLYRDILLEKGLWEFHANLRYQALRAFGGTSAKLNENENKVYEE